jgi:DNA mismatch repair protein MutS2
MLITQALERGIDLKAACDRVVPFSLSLSDTPRGLVISGPNTGGKTVCLKAVGLAVLMVQAGIPPTAASRSVVGRFDRVFADIGDEQSLALSLSTFSAHLKRVGLACRLATPASLVLLDELGVGTDPEEGAALARAVILTLVERGTAIVVTTHYHALKMLREESAAIENAAFVFDETDLAPTFELIVGRPGASFAIEIARRLDLPDALIQAAERGVRDDARRLSRLLARLAEGEARMTEQKKRLEDKETRLDALLAYNRQAEERWQRLSKSAEREARREARQIVDATRRETEQLVARIRRSQAEGQAVKDAHRTLKRLASQLEAKPETATPRKALSVGMPVVVKNLNKHGEIRQVLQDGTRVTVMIGSVQYTVSSAEVEPCEPPAAAPTPLRAAPHASRETFEIDLRGRTVEEAQLELQDLLDQVRHQGVDTVRVIHGRGTGVLRRELAAWFRQHPAVASSRLGGRGEGGDGVTLVTLKSL